MSYHAEDAYDRWVERAMKAEARISEVEAALRSVPISRMRSDYSGLECIGCGSFGSEKCRHGCWADAVERVMSSAPTASVSEPLASERVVSKSGSAIKVTEYELTPEAQAALSVGSTELPRPSDAPPRRVWRNKHNKSLLDQTPEELASGWEDEPAQMVSEPERWRNERCTNDAQRELDELRGHLTWIVDPLNRKIYNTPEDVFDQIHGGLGWKGLYPRTDNPRPDYDGSFDRLSDIIDEEFGIQPVMPPSEMLTFLEKQFSALRKERADIIVSLAGQRSETVPPEPCPCCEQAGELNVACVKYEKALEEIRVHASGECSHTDRERMQCFGAIEKIMRVATSETGSTE